LLLLAVAACRPRGDSTVVVDGRERTYELFVPTDTPGLPLLIALHGRGSTGKQLERETRFDAIAAREYFVVVYPDGVNHRWNDGRIDHDTPGVDDVAFIRSLIDELAARHAIDRGRVFATGMSNGAMMSYRLACELGGTIAAIAPVAGNLNTTIAPSCRPQVPVSVLAINGDADPIVRYDGEVGELLGAVASTERLAALDGCGPAGAAIDEPDLDPTDGTRSRHVDYGCAPPVAVELVTVLGGGHTWPGASQYLPKAAIGPVGRDFSASERIWAFFAAHRR
jgi:polyhydroxybutyrate depolymerase